MQFLLQHDCGEVWALGGGETQTVKNGMGMEGDKFN